MSHYGRRLVKNPHTASSTPSDFYHRRRRQRRAALLAITAGAPTLEWVADPEFLIDVYRGLEARGGHAPGPDGVTYADLGPTEIASLMREASKAIRRGDYRSGPSRKVAIPKSSGGTRTLTISNLIDRVIGAALNRVLTPTFEAISWCAVSDSARA